MDFARCYGCMREISAPGAVCPHCGYDNTNDPKDPVKQPPYVLPCGTVLNGRYIIGKMLGQGGFGITYIGWNLALEMPVCIKEFFPEGAAMRSSTQSKCVLWTVSRNAHDMKRGRESFVKEAQKAVKLRDLSHIVMAWDVFYENETSYIVMDYIEGETLKSRLLRTQKTLGEQACIELLTPIMEDLDKAHERGIVHRDIKPDNIMLTKDGEPMLLDMGAAKDLGKAAQNGGTLSSTAVVSQGFSPREQYRQKGNIGPWTDVYAMCATIIYCVSGKAPPTPMDRDDGEKLDLSMFSPGVAKVLEKGMALSVEDRIKTMHELLSALLPGKADVDNRSAVYDCACKLKERGAPDLAAELFKTLGDYRNAAKLAADCKKMFREASLPEWNAQIIRKEVPEKKPETIAQVKKRKPSSAQKRRLLPIGALAVLAVLIVSIFLGGKDKSLTVSDTASNVSSLSKREATPVPTPIGEPISTGIYGALSYEGYSNCICISGCEASATSAEIPTMINGKPVTSIGDDAFWNCIFLKTVTIPDGVSSIGDRAFYYCTALESVTIPDSVTSIGNNAFSYCRALTSVTIPNSVTSIGNDAFSYCRALTSITIPSSVTSIGNYAFLGCRSLESITISGSVTSIGDEAFRYCDSLSSIRIPDGVTRIGDRAFSRSALTSITIPDSVTSIGDSAFGSCNSLKDVYYTGTEKQWKEIRIASYNNSLTNATIHYNSQA